MNKPILCPWCNERMKEQTSGKWFFYDCECGARSPRHIDKEIAERMALRVYTPDKPAFEEFTPEEIDLCFEYGVGEKISNMGFYVRVENILKKNGVCNLSQLVTLKSDNLRRMRGMGKDSIYHVFYVTRKHIEKMLEEQKEKYEDADIGTDTDDDFELDWDGEIE